MNRRRKHRDTGLRELVQDMPAKLTQARPLDHPHKRVVDFQLLLKSSCATGHHRRIQPDGRIDFVSSILSEPCRGSRQRVLDLPDQEVQRLARDKRLHLVLQPVAAAPRAFQVQGLVGHQMSELLVRPQMGEEVAELLPIQVGRHPHRPVFQQDSLDLGYHLTQRQRPPSLAFQHVQDGAALLSTCQHSAPSPLTRALLADSP